MAKCSNCGCNDADVDWGICYECFCSENDRSGGALSSVAAINYDLMGMHNAATSCRGHAQKLSQIKEIQDALERSTELIPKILQLINSHNIKE